MKKEKKPATNIAHAWFVLTISRLRVKVLRAPLPADSVVDSKHFENSVRVDFRPHESAYPICQFDKWLHIHATVFRVCVCGSISTMSVSIV